MWSELKFEVLIVPKVWSELKFVSNNLKSIPYKHNFNGNINFNFNINGQLKT